MKMPSALKSWLLLVPLLAALGCAGTPVREAQTGVAAGQAAASREPAAPAAETAPAVPAAAPAAETAQASLALPLDPQVSTGKLENGLTWYVRPNRKPEKRAFLRLVVNAGSVLEQEDQRGLAHFVEHMAFNGTESFPKSQIVDFLESIGMRFGPETNAFTNYDETVYMLEIPTDDPAVLDKGVQILEEWAHRILFDPQEVAKERPVIIEEWRLGRGADARMFDRQVPILFQGSRYAERQPIGKVQVIEKADAAALRSFYERWYRPPLMAVVAVGDFDPAWMQEAIRRHFSIIPAGGPQGGRPEYTVPGHPQTLYAPATDPEATVSRVSIYIQHPASPARTVADYRRELLKSLYNSLLDARLEELTKKPDSPLNRAYSFSYRSVRPSEAYVLSARVRDDRIAQALEALLAESERVRRFGFTPTELERQKADISTYLQQAYRDRDNQDSSDLVQPLVDNFLEGEPDPSIEQEYLLVKRLLPGIGLEEVNGLSQSLLTDSNRVVLVNAPEASRQKVPSEQEVLAMFREVRTRSLQPYRDAVAEAPLFPGGRPTPAAIVQRSSEPELGLTEWRFANGARVLVKPTDFKADQVLFAAFSPGGDSLASDQDYVSAVTAATIVDESGLDGFDAVQLRKKLAGRAVEVTPYIGDLFEGFNGKARPEDLEVLLQLVNLYFTSPRRDEQAFQAYRQRVLTAVRNREASPETVFQDRVQELFSQGHFRRRPWSPALVEEMKLDSALRVYDQRFREAGDFTFLFVGKVEPEELEPLVASYLGSLPGGGQPESWRDEGIRPPGGVVQSTVRKGLEPKSRVEILFHGDYPWSLENRLRFDALGQVLDIELREAVREEAGGSYDVGAGAQLDHFPTERFVLFIGFGCAPEEVDKLTGIVLDKVRQLASRGPAEVDVSKVREGFRRRYQTDIKTNEYWLDTLQFLLMNGQPLAVALDYQGWVEALSAESLRALAAGAIRLDEYLRVVLLPEK
jgi:zinc protease